MAYPSKRLVALAVSFALGAPAAVYATNGMNLEGYGPEAAGMGGASMAYDNGPAAMMNNPATLGLMSQGSRFDLALGFLGPDVTTTMPAAAGGQSFDSASTGFFMPAMGWVKHSGNVTYGVGVFAQGGMGTEYAPGPGATGAAGMMMMGQTPGCLGMNAMMPGACTTSGTAATQMGAAGLQERSEVSVGRFIIPLSMRVNDQVTVGASLDYVWANMDIQMAMPGQSMWDMIGSGAINGSMVQGMMGMMTGGMPTVAQPLMDVYYGYFDFTDTSDYTGAAQGSGLGGKLGLTYQMTDTQTLGFSYHSETNISDLEATGAKMSMALQMYTGTNDPITMMPNSVDAVVPMTGTMTVKDFQWPSTFGIGYAYRPTSKAMLAIDWKRINWAAVMKDFKMVFVADSTQANPMAAGFAGSTLNATMDQSWKDQDVISMGGAYSPDDTWTFRMGMNFSPNPVPESTLNYLFPAIVENHLTFGTTYNTSKKAGIDFAAWIVPQKIQTSVATGMDSSMRQFNWQLSYHRNY